MITNPLDVDECTRCINEKIKEVEELSKQLKPCPFCGEKVKLTVFSGIIHEDKDSQCIFQRYQDQIEFGFGDEEWEELIKRWNMRV